ncbi:MAG TPA: hypothetical protein VHE35_31100 [Kofleriaceae bacterium]|nr:hypothetical protein [Kofleriaceae bacterium]
MSTDHPACRVTLCSLLSLAACHGGAHHAPAPPAPLSTIAHRFDGGGATAAPSAAPAPTGTSPLEQYAAGDRTFGIFGIDDAVHCDLAAWAATAPNVGLADAVVLPPSAIIGDSTVTVGAMAGGVRDDLSRILAALRDLHDSDIDGHHVCIVPASGVGVAVSIPAGYIAFEPAAILQMNQLIPDSDRTMFSSEVAFAHEFAHQIQFWYGDPFDGDKSVRRTELAADCMGTAFVAMTEPAGWITDQVEKGAAGALQAYADLEFRSKLHHGTRFDRAHMAHEGVAIVTASRNGGPALGLASIKRGCEQAVRGWDASQPLTPPDQLWGGEED